MLTYLELYNLHHSCVLHTVYSPQGEYRAALEADVCEAHIATTMKYCKQVMNAFIEVGR